MPCYDPRPDDPNDPYWRKEAYDALARYKAMLCGLIEAMGNEQFEIALSKFDAAKAGLSAAVVRQAYTLHKQEDDNRRTQEKAKREALAKLSDADLRVLGLKP